MDDNGEHGTDIHVHTGGPLSAHHLLLGLAREHRVALHTLADDVDHSVLAAEALEIWQTAPAIDGSRWRWLLLSRGLVIEEAPGDPHRLRPHEAIVLTVTRSMLPDREAVGAFRKGLRSAGASCSLTRMARTVAREHDTVVA
ncbi:hypothetical protein VY88_32975 [Azospirillum thiophilum]|uniref:Uncharacterized protein n=1 Tax=Azospirillum thiophilum TaxID=528244 RepID=A0AAC8W5X3_9PROT|nr:hypothetical protein [Azospirillum thiophilum]ALG75724.1 hypothetical protein AL072_32800 [Azospirillum thiophilum]KJR61214.1 hypothetical protein VY88_32975 [Azospirillum thiophilum]